MANNLIQIKRSTSTAVPGSLANGELAFTANGDILFIGSQSTVTPIAGKRFPGTLTANQALVANATSGIDKVIVANLVPTGIWANGAAGVGGQVLHSNSSGGVYWDLPTEGVAGSDTQVQFNDGGALAGDAGLTFNKTTDTLSAGKIAVVNTTASSNTTTGALTVAGGLGVAGRINVQDMAIGNDSVYATVNNTVIGTNNLFATGTVNGNILSVGGWVIANQSGIFTSGVVNGDIVSVGTAFKANTTQVTIGSGIGFSVNGSVGTSGQILYSNGTSSYWAAPPAGDITGVTAGNGLTGGGSSGEVTLDVGAGNGITVAADTVSVDGANGISVDSSGVNVQAGTDGGLSVNATGVWVVAGNGLLTNSTGLHAAGSNGVTTSADSIYAVGANGIGITSAGINVTGANGISVTSGGVAVTGANGISVTTAGVNVLGGSTVTVNTTGVHVNSTLSITDLTVSGNLTVLGDLVSLNVATLAVEDSLITLAKDQGSTTTFTDAVDVGFFGVYGNTINTKYAGLFRDQSDSGVFKLFDGQIPAPTTTVDTANVNFALATLQALFKTGNSTVTSFSSNLSNVSIFGAITANTTAANVVANSTYSVAIVANTLSLSTALPATSGGTGLNSYTSGDIIVANTGNALSKLALGTSGYVLQSNGTAVVYDTLDGGTF